MHQTVAQELFHLWVRFSYCIWLEKFQENWPQNSCNFKTNALPWLLEQQSDDMETKTRHSLCPSI